MQSEAEADAKHKKELLAEAMKRAQEMAEETAKKRDALASTEAPASVVFGVAIPC
jgi:hypothetical protein